MSQIEREFRLALPSPVLEQRDPKREKSAGGSVSGRTLSLSSSFEVQFSYSGLVVTITNERATQIELVNDIKDISDYLVGRQPGDQPATDSEVELRALLFRDQRVGCVSPYPVEELVRIVMLRRINPARTASQKAACISLSAPPLAARMVLTFTVLPKQHRSFIASCVNDHEIGYVIGETFGADTLLSVVPSRLSRLKFQKSNT